MHFFKKANPGVNVLVRSCFLAAYLITSSCQKHESDSGIVSGQNMPKTGAQTDERKLENEAILENSKREAVARFPDLGVAGSEMNKAFLARVSHLKAMGQLELNGPNWPYVVAVEVKKELEKELEKAKEKTAIDKKERLERDKRQAFVTQIFTVSELLQEKKVPFAEIGLAGIVTKVDLGVANRLSASIVLDDKIKCEFGVSTINYGKSKVEIGKRGDSLFTLYRGLTSAEIVSEVPLYKVGQRVQLLGRIQKKVMVVCSSNLILPI